MAAGNHVTRRSLVAITLPDRTLMQITESRIRQPGFGSERPNWQRYERRDTNARVVRETS